MVKNETFNERLYKHCFKKQCEECGTKNNLTLHHKISKRNPNHDFIDNFQTLCRECHNLKHLSESKKEKEKKDIKRRIYKKKKKLIKSNKKYSKRYLESIEKERKARLKKRLKKSMPGTKIK